MEERYEIVEVDEKNEKVKVRRTRKGNQETKIFTFDNFEIDYDKIKVGQKLRIEQIEDSKFFTLLK